MGQVINFAQKAIIEKGNKILVVRNALNIKRNPGMIDFPGGRIHFGENVDEHIIREVKEETGVLIKPLNPIYLTSWIVKQGDDTRVEVKENDLQVVAVVRRCKYVSGRKTTLHNVEDELLDSVFWLSPTDLLKEIDFTVKNDRLLPALKEYLHMVNR